jgi:anti-sigma factor RsiW
MISCFFHQPALRRHLDDNEPLAARAQSHLDACPRCREMVAAHLAIIKNLSANRGDSIETPPFLHARVVNDLRKTQPEKPRAVLHWATAAAAIALVSVGIAALVTKPTPPRTASFPKIETQIAFQTSLPANPLEVEIQNLRADTLNAAKALAANFLPQTDSEK